MLFVEFLLFLARIPWWNHIWWTYVHVLWIHKNNLNTLSKRIKWMSFFLGYVDKKYATASKNKAKIREGEEKRGKKLCIIPCDYSISLYHSRSFFLTLCLSLYLAHAMRATWNIGEMAVKKNTCQVNTRASELKLCWQWLKYMENIADIYIFEHRKKGRQTTCSINEKELFIYLITSNEMNLNKVKHRAHGYWLIQIISSILN